MSAESVVESRAAQVLELALGQINTFIKECGAHELGKVVEGKPDGYARLVWALEKLSKCALEWQEYRAPRTRAKNDAERLSTGAPGPSPETIEDFQQFLEGFS